MNKLTDAEIVKALECCKSFDDLRACYKCPALQTEGCASGKTYISDFIIKEILDLINRQKAEIEELRKGFTADADYFASEYDSKIKAEAIKELREKCVEHQDFHKGDDGKFRGWISVEDLDRVIDEL